MIPEDVVRYITGWDMQKPGKACDAAASATAPAAAPVWGPSICRYAHAAYRLIHVRGIPRDSPSQSKKGFISSRFIRCVIVILWFSQFTSVLGGIFFVIPRYQKGKETHSMAKSRCAWHHTQQRCTIPTPSGNSLR